MVSIIVKKLRRKWARHCALLVMAAAILGWQVPVADAASQEVTVLVDTSYSMNDSDAMGMVPESVQELMALLPKEDNAAVISYGTSAQILVPWISVSDWKMEALPIWGNQGYTNTGEAMQMALAQLGGKKGSIVILTDGEIMLPTTEGTLASLQAFNRAIEQAAQTGTSVDIFSLQGEREHPVNFLHTGYATDVALNPPELLEGIRKLARERFHASFLEFSLEADGNGLLKAELPVMECSKVRLLAVALQEGTVSSESEGLVPVWQGRYLKCFEAKTLQDSKVSLKTSYPKGTKVQLVALPEVDGVLKALLRESGDGSRSVEISLLGKVSGKPLLEASYFEGKHVQLQLDGKPAEGTVQDGKIVVSSLADGQGTVKAENIGFSELGIIFLGKNCVNVQKNESASRDFMYENRIMLLLVSMLILAGLSARWVYHRRMSQAGRKEQERIKTGFSYRGKLVLYVMKHLSDEDIPPVEYNLFRRYDGTEVSLSEVMESCGLKISFPGSERIWIGPLERGIYLRNASDCTLLRQNEILLKEHQQVLQFDENIYIVFEDERTELLIVYKSQKPSAR